MSKLVALSCVVMLLLPTTESRSNRFAKYKTVEVYEIRPGLLMMPTYSDDGQLCEVGLQRRNYSPEKIRLDSSLTREEIDQALDELVPVNERGARSKDHGDILGVGNTMTTIYDYENVQLQVYGETAMSKGSMVEKDIAATIRWKNRKCGQS